MRIFSRKESLLLFLGDMIVFAFSLWLALFLRTGNLPSGEIYATHVVPFSIIFLVWALVFFIAGLYDKYTTVRIQKLSATVFNAQLANSALAVAFFYFISYFGITPKTTLFIELGVAFVLIYIWRAYSRELLGLKTKESAVIVGRGEELAQIVREVNDNPHTAWHFVLVLDVDTEQGNLADSIMEKARSENVSVVVADFENERVKEVLPRLYELLFSGVRYISIDEVYEEIFDRIPTTLVKHEWFLENISHTVISPFYAFGKRSVDIVAGFFISFVALLCLPFVALAIKMEDGGKIFFTHERIGKNNKTIRVRKFRSMSEKEKEKILKVGSFLRKTRIDELPQGWNVFVGDISLIGPRPETPALVLAYEKEIPYYNIRHLVKPGLSGWAQIYQENPPKYGVDFGNTADKLSYDLYYIKNRSFILEIHIALKTLKDLISRRGK